MENVNETLNALEEFNREFFQLCEARHATGAEEYGPLAFLENDMFRFIYEELADVANYARYLYIKLRTIQEVLDAGGVDYSSVDVGALRDKDEVSPGAASFVASEKVSGFLPLQEQEG